MINKLLKSMEVNINMLNEILDTCKFVASNSKDVVINNDKIYDFATKIDINKNVHWLEDSPFEILDFDIDKIVNFLLIYHSVGFSYWGNPKWTISTNNGEIDGGYAMMYCLLNEMKKDVDFINTKNLVNMSEEKFKDILKGNVEIPLFHRRYENIINVCKIVNEKMNGNFYEYIKNINNDVELFNVIIDNFPQFDDKRTYKGKKIYFYKLAQLLVSDILHIRNLKENIKVDYSHIAGCADYKIAQILRELRIIEYSSRLSKLVDNKIEILENSTYEVEIRASAIVVIDKIVKFSSSSIYPININDYIWLKGQDKSKIFKPYHLTRTTTY